MNTTNKALTVSQVAALKMVVTAWDVLDQNERSRWGHAYTGFADWTTKMGRDTTLHALVTAGMVEVKHTEHITHPLLRGAYGRWIGGSRRQAHIESAVRPTKSGRAYLATETV